MGGVLCTIKSQPFGVKEIAHKLFHFPFQVPVKVLRNELQIYSRLCQNILEGNQLFHSFIVQL